VALIGPNGAGKSTCFACLAGQQMPTAGQVLWQGHALLDKSPAERQRLGVARTFQVAQTFEALTVLQNIQLVMLGAAPLAWWDLLDRRQPERAMQLAAQAGLQDQAQATVADLPYGAKKRLELAMALAGLPEPGAEHGPSLLLLDEPAAGLALAERADMMALVRQVAAQGVTVLYTEHNMDAVFGVADRVLVLMQGRLVADGLPEVVAQDPQVREPHLAKVQTEMEQNGVLLDAVHKAVELELRAGQAYEHAVTDSERNAINGQETACDQVDCACRCDTDRRLELAASLSECVYRGGPCRGL
jgi:branched-chain amino acid transport system ATP-binding protein